MMFFTDAANVWSASLDGGDRRLIVDTHMNEVTGLTVDIPNRRVYFSDGKADRIESLNYDGSDRQTILTRRTLVPQVFDVDVFNDR